MGNKVKTLYQMAKNGGYTGAAPKTVAEAIAAVTSTQTDETVPVRQRINDALLDLLELVFPDDDTPGGGSGQGK